MKERVKKRESNRIKLKRTYFGNESKTTTKAMIAKIEKKIKKGEDYEGISNVMENFQREVIL